MALRQMLIGTRRTTVTVDEATTIALHWLKGNGHTSASVLLRQAAHERLAAHGMRVHDGRVMPSMQANALIEEAFAKRLAATERQ